MSSKLFSGMLDSSEFGTEVGRKMYIFLFALTLGSMVSFQVWSTIYTNFAVEGVGLNGAQNGIVQSIREVPGLLGVGVILFLAFMREQTLAALSIATLGLGVLLTGFFPSYSGLVVCTFILSMGFHYFETVNQSLILQAYSFVEAPLVMGRLRGITAGVNIAAGAFVLLCASFLEFRHMFAAAGLLGLGAGIYGLTHLPDTKSLPKQRRGMVLRTKYWLFYALTMLAGARRQIFTVFSIFLLVDRFGYSIVSITILFMINNTVNWFLNPLIGKAINRFGERKLLSLEYFSAIFIFMGYALTDSHIVAGLLYIVDQLIYNFAIAVRTFFQKIADPADIAPSMAVGVTVNHISAVVVPALGGMLWLIDYRITFYMGAGLTVLSLLLTQLIDGQIKMAGKN